MTERAARKMLVDAIRQEILGPREPDELLVGVPPFRRYVVGQLLPCGATGTQIQTESAVPELEESGLGREGGAAESEVSGPADATVEHRTAVSSMGLSFVVNFKTKLVIDVEWGEYDEETAPRNEDSGASDGHKPCWRRRQQNKTVPLPEIDSSPVREEIAITPRARLTVISRSDGYRAVVSAFLVNTSEKGGTGDPRLYQPKLRVRSEREEERPFLSRDLLQREVLEDDEDAADNALLHRNRKEYAVGRHVAVKALGEDVRLGVATVLETETVPTFELPATAARKSLGTGDVLEMRNLADATDRSELAERLDRAFDEYEAWLATKRTETHALRDDLRETALRRFAACEERLLRIRRGIECIRSDEDTFQCFKASNEAMARVRFRQPLLLGEAQREDSRFDPQGRDGRWYPFQLGFLLSILSELAFPEDVVLGQFRNTVDVLFFPTGGGKTEAYLGAMAFSALYRRRKGNGAGVSSVLRYTYRLLSSQQFARSATLVCALETLRSEANHESVSARVPWLRGKDAFSTGLWIGGDHSPNTRDAAAEAVEYFQSIHTECTRDRCELVEENKARPPLHGVVERFRGGTPPQSSPLVIPQCPWCGADLCIGYVWINPSTERTSFSCPDDRCAFHAPRGEPEESFEQRIGLPIVTVDEEIFRSCPTVLVGTADKFATLWYRPAARSLFGKISGFCNDHGYLTPLEKTHNHPGATKACDLPELGQVDLYVQDELHLINEALGSAYGLVECAVDALSAREGILPKKIGATATIRRAKNQIDRLFDREASIFPVAPLDAGASYFAEEMPPSDENPGRLYVGVYAPSQSRLYALDQAIAATMDGAHKLARATDEQIADPYLTLVLYFNTLRDLGQVQGLLVDDIPKHLRMIAGFRDESPRELHNVKQELTSKTAQSEIRETERKLRATFADEARNGRFGCDAVCATSMLSVGIDIPRLGAMLVDGQPKTTAEYIQATSRVGRKKPGIVLTVYNPNRPRDLSHYEHFYAYHAALYKYVESPSVTPTSFGTIDKYLANVFIALYRLCFGFRSGDEPIPFEAHQAAVRATFDAIAARVQAIGGSVQEVDYASAGLEDLVDEWHGAAARPGLKYVFPSKTFSAAQAKKVKETRYVARVDDPKDDPSNVLFKVPMSLRNVEPELDMVILR